MQNKTPSFIEMYGKLTVGQAIRLNLSHRERKE